MTASHAQSLPSIQAMMGMSHLRSHMGRSMRISMSWRSLLPTWLHNRFDAQSEPQEPFPVFPASRNRFLLEHSYPLTLIYSTTYILHYSYTRILPHSFQFSPSLAIFIVPSNSKW